MALIIDDTRFVPATRPAENINWLLGNRGDRQTVQIDFRVRVYSEVEGNFHWEFRNDHPIYTDVVETTNGDAAFNEFQVGDTVYFEYYIAGALQTHTTTVVHVAPSGAWMAVADPFPKIGVSTNAFLEFKSLITGVRFFWNLIENNDPNTYASKIDGDVQVAQADGLDYTDTSWTNFTRLGFKSHQMRDATMRIKGRNTGDLANQDFTLEFDLDLLPLVLKAEWSDYLLGLAPNYFENQKCLKMNYKLEAARDITNPNTFKGVSIGSVLGNTGWFNENWNTNLTNYSVSNLEFKRLDDTIIDDIELTEEEQKITFRVTNTTDSPFSDTNTPFSFIFNYAPSLLTEYRDQPPATGRYIQENFWYDRAQGVVGNGTVVGEESAYDNWSIKTIEATYVDADNIDVEVRMQFTAAGVAYLTALPNQRYQVAFSVENHALAIAASDRVTLDLKGVNNTMYIDYTDEGLVSITGGLLEHYQDVAAAVNSTADAWPEDEWVGKTSFSIDLEDRADDDISLVSVSGQIVSKKIDADPEVLDEVQFAIPLAAPIADGVPYIANTTNRGFPIPEALRRDFVVERDEASDTEFKRFYNVRFPWVQRWETWVARQAAAAFAADQLDSSEPNNGLNENWHRYDNPSEWTNVFRLKIVMNKNGNELTYTQDYTVDSRDYESNPEWDNYTQVSKDSSGTPLLGIGGEYVIYGNASGQDTTIEISFEKVTGPVPALADVYMVMGIHIDQVGTRATRRRISSEWDVETPNIWKSSDASNRVVITKVGSVYTGTAVIDHTQLPPGDYTYRITGRIGVKK